jgi:hypothetical protein
VLSKLRYFAAGRTSVDPSNLDLSSATALYDGRIRTRDLVTGGTLNAGLLADLDGTEVFLKTHLYPEGRENLRREAAVMKAASPASFEVDYQETPDSAIGKRGWLIMPALHPLAVNMDPDDVWRMVETFERRLQGATLDSDDDLALLAAEGRAGLQRLEFLDLVDADAAAAVDSHLGFLEDHLNDFPRIICHGDLGPENILSGRHGPIAVDWEDAFWGIEGYDFLYWLTFMRNREYCNRDTIQRSPCGVKMSSSLLTLIVLLKSYLSVISGSYTRNKVSINSRLTDIVHL